MGYFELAIWGYFLYAFAPSVTLLRDDEHISRAVSGLHGTALAAGTVLAGIFGSRLIRRFGRAHMMWAALTIMAGGVVIITSCKVFPITMAGALIAGLGGTLTNNIVTAMLTAHHQGRAARVAVTQGNGLGSGAGIFAPLLIGGSIALGVGWRAGMLIILVPILAVIMKFRHTVTPDAIGVQPPEAHAATGRLPLEYWRACFVIVMTTAIEFSMTIWSSDVLHNHFGLSKGMATTGVTAIVAGMTVGRFASGRLTLRYHADALLLCVFGISISGFVVFWMATVPWAAFVGLFITGLGISLQFPLAITRAIGFAGGRPDLGAAYTSLATGSAIALAPFGLGAFADHVGAHTALLVVPVFVLLGIVGVATTRGRPLAVPAAVIGDVQVNPA
jgi:MFS family permease